MGCDYVAICDVLAFVCWDFVEREKSDCVCSRWCGVGEALGESSEIVGVCGGPKVAVGTVEEGGVGWCFW